uniref:Uncharacterized protein n=1 Tax=Oryza sativa subsp. japonica TaxID=39947 RepID=Q69K22_ORYSJ|nr:hypothetical protein [Oryza sativa Japonica Group]
MVASRRSDKSVLDKERSSRRRSKAVGHCSRRRHRHTDDIEIGSQSVAAVPGAMRWPPLRWRPKDAVRRPSFASEEGDSNAQRPTGEQAAHNSRGWLASRPAGEKTRQWRAPAWDSKGAQDDDRWWTVMAAG